MPPIRLIDFSEIFPEPEEPEGGWIQPTCTWESHKWALEIEDGSFHIKCLDPCDMTKIDPNATIPVCEWGMNYCEPTDFGTPWDAPMPIRLEFVDDSTPSTPMGPAEYGYYILVHDEATKMRKAITEALNTWHQTGYVGGPSEKEAWDKMWELLGEYRFEDPKGVPSED